MHGFAEMFTSRHAPCRRAPDVHIANPVSVRYSQRVLAKVDSARIANVVIDEEMARAVMVAALALSAAHRIPGAEHIVAPNSPEYPLWKTQREVHFLRLVGEVAARFPEIAADYGWGGTGDL